jgi:hypothetical protein
MIEIPPHAEHKPLGGNGGSNWCRNNWRNGVRSKQQGNSMTIGKPFQKGQNGNPGGRPKVVAEVRELARAHTGEAVQTLVSIVTNPKSAPAARVSAANSLLDRGYGKPPQHITGEDGPSYVVRLPAVCETADEWIAQCGSPTCVRRSTRSPGDSTAQ